LASGVAFLIFFALPLLGELQQHQLVTNGSLVMSGLVSLLPLVVTTLFAHRKSHAA
jgi:hypothetical protein